MRRLHSVLLAVAMFSISACSGGGTATPGLQPSPSLAGAGTTAVLNQKITFTITVPAPMTGSSKHRANQGLRGRSAAATPAATTPYVSPATAAIVLTLADVDGVSFQKAPPPIPAIPVKCQGCTFTAPNIIAALGVNRYIVQTYSGYANGQAAGNLISVGFVDVTVPAHSPAVIGGAAALSVGGYVAQISMAPIAVNFTLGVAGQQNLFVRALDAGGATIVGAVQYESPIVVSLPPAVTSFLLDGGVTESIAAAPQKPIALSYTGAFVSGTTITATSQDENGATVTATAAANVLFPTPTPTPSGPHASPTPVPPTSTPIQTPPPKALSLYVADAAADTVSEYGFVTALEANGVVPNPLPTPQRVLQFVPARVPNQQAIGLACTQSPFTLAGGGNVGNGTNGVTVGADGTIFMFPTCQDTNFNTYVYGFSANAVGQAAPTIVDPIGPAYGGAFGGFAEALTYAPQQNIVFAGFQGTTNIQTALAGFGAKSNGQQPSTVSGTTCFLEFGFSSCNFVNGTGYFNLDSAAGFGVDAAGNAYLPATWTDTPTGVAGRQNLFQPATVLAVNATQPSIVTQPSTAIAGIESLVGGSFSFPNGQPLAATVDGTTLYVLGGIDDLTVNTSDPLNPIYVFPGLSSCPPPGLNAPTNTVDANGPFGITNCADGFMHTYLAAYQISQLGGQSGDVDLIPQWIIGGDQDGKFGCEYPNNVSPGSSFSGGEWIAASAGFVYVLNEIPNCNAPNFAPEIDVYDTNKLPGPGSYTDILPILTLPFHGSFPSALVIGPSGSVTGGQSISRLSPHGGYRQSLHRWPPTRRREFRKLHRPPPYVQ